PTAAWKKKILLAEHSPIRQLIIKWKWGNLKYWVSVHFVRHKIGIEHFVGTQRTDRTGVDREEKPQSSAVSHECIANAQAIINISRKRLCNCASKDSRDAWKAVLRALKKQDPIIESVCVPECVYRGFCPEMHSCGYADTKKYRKQLEQYKGVE
ncbi:MAG: thymidylate synthase ThyX, partial [bacterium]|nr:thymidylate synthase ThyX [bacterium]